MVYIFQNKGLQVRRIKTQSTWHSCLSCGRSFNSGQTRYEWRLVHKGYGFSFWRTDCSSCVQLMMKDTMVSLNLFLKAILK